MSTNEDLLRCPICLEFYRKPRALPCLHTFCQDCLQDFINTTVRSNQATGGFGCPVCRRQIQPKTANLHTKWAETFEMNYIIVTLLDNYKQTETVNAEKKGSSPDQGEIQTGTFTSGVATVHSPENIDCHPEKGTNDQQAGNFEHFHPPPPHWPRPHHGPWHHPPHYFPPHHHGPPPRGGPPHHGCHPPRCHGGRFRHPHGPPRHHGPRHHPHHPPPWGPPRGPPPPPP